MCGRPTTAKLAARVPQKIVPVMRDRGCIEATIGRAVYTVWIFCLGFRRGAADASSVVRKWPIGILSRYIVLAQLVYRRM